MELATDETTQNLQYSSHYNSLESQINGEELPTSNLSGQINSMTEETIQILPSTLNSNSMEGPGKEEDKLFISDVNGQANSMASTTEEATQNLMLSSTSANVDGQTNGEEQFASFLNGQVSSIPSKIKETTQNLPSSSNANSMEGLGNEEDSLSISNLDGQMSSMELTTTNEKNKLFISELNGQTNKMTIATEQTTQYLPSSSFSNFMDSQVDEEEISTSSLNRQTDSISSIPNEITQNIPFMFSYLNGQITTTELTTGEIAQNMLSSSTFAVKDGQSHGEEIPIPNLIGQGNSMPPITEETTQNVQFTSNSNSIDTVIYDSSEQTNAVVSKPEEEIQNLQSLLNNLFMVSNDNKVEDIPISKLDMQTDLMPPSAIEKNTQNLLSSSISNSMEGIGSDFLSDLNGQISSIPPKPEKSTQNMLLSSLSNSLDGQFDGQNLVVPSLNVQKDLGYVFVASNTNGTTLI